MSGKEVIPFTVKGPISLQQIEGGLDHSRRTGCAFIDLCLQVPCQIGELVLSNYYTAWMSIYVKRAPATRPTICGTVKPPNSGSATVRSRPHFERSISVDFPGTEVKGKAGTDNGADDLFLLETMHSSSASTASNSSRRRHSSGPHELSERPWECSIQMKTLMPCPHFEAGCQDVFSIPATESLVELRDVLIVRLVLHQPSTVWKRFSVEDISLFRTLPKRGFSQADDLSRQREGWLATLRLNTKKMLGGQLVEPEKYESDDGEP